MTNNANAIVGCNLIGEYVDESEVPADIAFHHGEVVRPQVVANYLDDAEIKEFTVLLNDGRVVSVRGHRLTQLPPTVPGETGSYGVIVRTGGAEAIIALFKILDVVGIFHGEMRSDRKIA